MRGLVYVASRDKVDVDTYHKGIQYALEKLGKSKFGFERTAVSNFKSKRKDTRALGTSLLIIPELRVLVLTKRHVGSGNEIALMTPISFPEPSLPLSSGTGKRRPLRYCVSARHFIGQQQSMRNFTGN